MPAEFIEYIDWDREALEEATFGIVGFYVKGLAPLGTRKWVRYAVENLLPVVRGKNSYPVEFMAEGFTLTFFAPTPVARPIIEGDQIVWRQAEPRFLLEDNPTPYTRPKFKTLLRQLNWEIAAEAADYYHLDIQHHPLTYTFPKRIYSSQTSVSEAAPIKLKVS